MGWPFFWKCRSSDQLSQRYPVCVAGRNLPQVTPIRSGSQATGRQLSTPSPEMKRPLWTMPWTNKSTIKLIKGCHPTQHDLFRCLG
jgi:hypothetical protein